MISFFKKPITCTIVLWMIKTWKIYKNVKFVLDSLPFFSVLTDNLYVFCLFCLIFVEFFVPLENFSLIWRCHLCRWRAANFNLSSALVAIEHWGFFSLPYLLWHGASVKMVISEDLWHSHLILNVWHWNCHYLF